MHQNLLERVVASAVDEPYEALRIEPLEPGMVPVYDADGQSTDPEVIEEAAWIREALLLDLKRFPKSFWRILRQDVIESTEPRFAWEFLRDLESKRAIANGAAPPNRYWAMESQLLQALRWLRECSHEYSARVKANPGRRCRPVQLRRYKKQFLFQLWQYGLFQVPRPALVRDAARRCRLMEQDLQHGIHSNRHLAGELKDRLRTGIYLKGHGKRKRGDRFSQATRLNFRKKTQKALNEARLYQEQLEEMRSFQDPLSRYCAAPAGICWVE